MLDITSFPAWLKTEVRGAIAILTFNRPDQENRYDEYGEIGNVAEVDEYRRFFREANEDPKIRVIIQTGTGAEWFSAGPLPAVTHSAAHFSEGGLSDEYILWYINHIHFDRDWVRELLEYKKPVITVLNGSVMSKPFTWMLASDFIIAERHVKLRAVQLLYGILAASSAFLWPMNTGLLKAKRWIMTGDELDAETADAIGLVSEVVDSGEGMRRGLAQAEQLSKLRPETLWLTKRSLNAWLLNRYEELFVAPYISEIAMLPRRNKPNV